MNESAIRTEEQIISLFSKREILVCRGWVLLGGNYAELAEKSIREQIVERQNAGEIFFTAEEGRGRDYGRCEVLHQWE